LRRVRVQTAAFPGGHAHLLTTAETGTGCNHVLVTAVRNVERPSAHITLLWYLPAADPKASAPAADVGSHEDQVGNTDQIPSACCTYGAVLQVQELRLIKKALCAGV